MNLSNVFKTSCYVFALVFGYLIGYFIFYGSSYNLTMAGVFSWWSALYFGYVFRVGLSSAFGFAVFSVIFSIFDFVFSLGIIQEGSQSSFLFHFLVSALGFFVFVSPIFVNLLISFFMSRIDKWFE